MGTSGRDGDVMFSYHGANGPESSTSLYLEEFCQVAAQGRIKVGAIDAAALGPFLKQVRVRTDKNFLEA